MNTPWGMSDSVRTIERGVHWVGTPSHGGLMVSLAKARAIFSEKTIRLAHPGQIAGYVCFEEDCSYAVAFYARPEFKRFLDKHSLAEWELSVLDPESYMGKAKAESVPKLRAEIAKTNAEISADMERIIRQWNPEYFAETSQRGAA
jgi:hypothetical protein